MATTDPMVATLAALSNHAALTALVGSRIHAYRVPDVREWPCVTFTVASTVPYMSLSGKGDQSRVTMQVDAWSAESGKQARDICTAVVDAMDDDPLLNVGAIDTRGGYDRDGKRYRVSADFSCCI